MITPRTELSGNSVAAHYDGLDRFYRDIWGEHIHHGLWRSRSDRAEAAVEHLIALVAERAEISRGDRVCDVGCGYGATARLLAREFGADVTGLTISPAQHAHATAVDAGASNPTYLLRDWNDNQLPDASFDVVLAIESTEHMADKPRFFREAQRVLRPGGRLVVCAWLACPAPRRWEVQHLLEPICREGRLPGMGTAEEYLEFARAARLEPAGVEDRSAQVKRTWPICARRALWGLLREPAYRQFLFRSGSPDRVFALTIFRIWLAYETGSMRYGILTALKPVECLTGVRPGVSRTERFEEAAAEQGKAVRR